MRTVLACGAEEIFPEPVNGRGPGLRLTQEALASQVYGPEKSAVEAIRHQLRWSEYVVGLLRNLQAAVRELADIRSLRFLLYPSRLLPED